MLDKYQIEVGKTYNCIDYANEVFEPVQILFIDITSGDIAYRVMSTEEEIYFSGQGGFEVI